MGDAYKSHCDLAERALARWDEKPGQRHHSGEKWRAHVRGLLAGSAIGFSAGVGAAFLLNLWPLLAGATWGTLIGGVAQLALGLLLDLARESRRRKRWGKKEAE